MLSMQPLLLLQTQYYTHRHTPCLKKSTPAAYKNI